MDKKLATQTSEMPQETQQVETMWNGNFCDECGVIAVFTAKQLNYELNFCGHHVRKNADSLKAAGFTINPDNYFL